MSHDPEAETVIIGGVGLACTVDILSQVILWRDVDRKVRVGRVVRFIRVMWVIGIV